MFRSGVDEAHARAERSKDRIYIEYLFASLLCKMAAGTAATCSSPMPHQTCWRRVLSRQTCRTILPRHLLKHHSQTLLQKPAQTPAIRINTSIMSARRAVRAADVGDPSLGKRLRNKCWLVGAGPGAVDLLTVSKQTPVLQPTFVSSYRLLHLALLEYLRFGQGTCCKLQR